MLKTLKIKEETHARLLEFGKKGESFDELFNRLLDANIPSQAIPRQSVPDQSSLGQSKPAQPNSKP